MNPYTSTWTGVTPGDGPQEVHVVLLDNGRTRALADEVGRQALRCIRCSACLNVCPVYERVGGHAYGSVYPGPIGAILNPLLQGSRGGPADRLAALRLLAVRRLLRGLPGADRHPRGARRPARPGRRRPPRRRAEAGSGRDEGALPRRSRPRSGSASPSGSRGVRHRAGPTPPGGFGLDRRARPADPAPVESFRAWWKRTDGGRIDERGERLDTSAREEILARVRERPAPRQRRRTSPGASVRRRPRSTSSPSGSTTTARSSSGAAADG